MVGVVGFLVIRVRHITETKAVANENLAVPMKQLLVLVFEKWIVILILVVLGLTILSLVLGLMSILVVLPLAVQ
jgi:hypothetical protein